VPSLAEQLADRPEALGGLVRFLAGRVLGGSDEKEAEALASEAEGVIASQLPGDYGWPGNIRELEQCLRSVLVRRTYTPPRPGQAVEVRPTWLAAAEAGTLSADELLSAYCRHVHGQQGGYEQAARVLGLDRRTVKARCG
jgi:transcriptional regulator of acetoin/glycerol metabolism